jgi:hypothetical protein
MSRRHEALGPANQHKREQNQKGRPTDKHRPQDVALP